MRFPRETIPASVAVVQLGTFLVMLALVLPIALIVRGTLEPDLLLLPLVVALMFAFVLGLSFGVSVLHAHFRDVEPILTAVLLPWFFITPIFLPVEEIPGVADHELIGDLLEWANPVAPFIDSVRELLYSGAAPGIGQLAYLVGVGLGALMLGHWTFRRMERDLAVVL